MRFTHVPQKLEMIPGSSSIPFDSIENDSEGDIPSDCHAQDQNDGESKWGIKRSRSFSLPIPKEESKRTKRRTVSATNGVTCQNVSNASKPSLSNNSVVGVLKLHPLLVLDNR